MPSFSFSYEYDRAGNRSKMINNLTSEVTTYVYDSANQLISMEGPDGTTTFDWDAAGNMIAKHAPEGTTTYTWDYRNRLTQVAPPVGDPINFAYNAMGQRIQKNGTRFIYDGVQLLQETDLNNQTLRSNTFTNEGYGDLVSENDGTDSSFPTFNAQSSTDAIVNKTATVTDRISYSAFGGQDSHTGSSTTPFRFVGKQSYYHDSETGLYLLGAGGNSNGAGRYYDPELGRFISRDPLGLAGGDVNLYRYAGNNPVNRIDPMGLEESPVCDSCSIDNFKGRVPDGFFDKSVISQVKAGCIATMISTYSGSSDVANWNNEPIERRGTISVVGNNLELYSRLLFVYGLCGEKCISTLNLSGHGSSGTGFRYDKEGKIRPFNDQMNSDIAERIRNLLCEDAVVIVHACGHLDEDADLQALARTLQRRVCACRGTSDRPFGCYAEQSLPHPPGHWWCVDPPGKSGIDETPFRPSAGKRIGFYLSMTMICGVCPLLLTKIYGDIYPSIL